MTCVAAGHRPGRSVIRAAIVVAALLPGACAAPPVPAAAPAAMAAAGPPAALHFSCPEAGTTTVLVRNDGSRGRQLWRGAAEGDADLCVVETAHSQETGGPPERRLFGLLDEDQQGLPEETRTMHAALDQLLRRGAEHVQFITRSGNVQRVQQWSVAGRETLPVNGCPLPVVRLHVTVVNASNAKQIQGRDLWIDPVSDVFVRQEFSLNNPVAVRQRGFRVVSLVPAGGTEGATAGVAE